MRTLRLALIAPLAAAAACGGPDPAGTDVSLPAKELAIARIDELPSNDPESPAWSAARVVVVPLLAQDVAEPRLSEKGVEALRLRALHDGTRVAFHLSWENDTAEELVDVDRSTDAVALQLPATGADGPIPDSMMGEEGRPVSIHLWRYSWQRRLQGHPFGIDALYPNAAVDHYPPEGARDEAARSELERLYDPPAAVGNPLARARPPSAVEDLRAEGFGTLSHTEKQSSTGVGRHADGRWSVVITRPLDLAPGSTGRLRPGEETYVAVAVWDGAGNHSGSRKMRSVWVPVRFAEAMP